MSERCGAVHAFADGELPPRRAAVFLRHLAGCPRCQAEVESILVLAALAETMAEERGREEAH